MLVELVPDVVLAIILPKNFKCLLQERGKLKLNPLVSNVLAIYHVKEITYLGKWVLFSTRNVRGLLIREECCKGIWGSTCWAPAVQQKLGT